MKNTSTALNTSLRRPPSPSAFARKRKVSPLQARHTSTIIVSGFNSARVGSLGIMTVAVTVTIGHDTWHTGFSEVFLTQESSIPRMNPSPLPWPLVEVSDTHPDACEAKKFLAAKVDEAIASLQRIHGALPVLTYLEAISDRRCQLKPRLSTMRMTTLRSEAHALAQARITQAAPVMMELCPQQGSLFAVRNIEQWKTQATLCAPLINTGLRPIVVATDAGRSNRSATVAVAASTGKIHIYRSEKTLAIRELEMEGIASAMVHFTKKYPNRKVVILCDSRPALNRIKSRGFGIAEVDAILASGLITLRWVRGHNGHGLNDIADRAARILRMKIECRFSDEWFKDRYANLRAELLENLRTDSALNSYFFGITQRDLALAG